MPDTTEKVLLSDKRLSASLRLVLEYFFERGAAVKAVYSHGRRRNTYIILRYKGIDIPLRSTNRRFSHLLNSTFSASVAANKYISSKFLAKFGIPTPKTAVIKSVEQADRFLTRFEKVVVKPISGRHGNGVTVNITSYQELRQAIHHARRFGRESIMQQHVPGEDYRLLFVNYELVAALRRHRPYITGDGRSTIGQLIKDENERRQRLGAAEAGSNFSFWREAPKSKISLMEVRRQNGHKLLRRVPESSEKVTILQTANISAGAFSEDVTRIVNPELPEKLGRLLKELGLGLCGVDILSEDISAPLSAQKTFVIELNSWPGLLPHARPHYGKSRNIGKIVAEAIYKKQKELIHE